MCLLGAAAFAGAALFPHVLPEITPFMAPYWYASVPLALSGLGLAVWTDRYVFDAAHGILQVYSRPFGIYPYDLISLEDLAGVQFRRWISRRTSGPATHYRVTLLWPDREPPVVHVCRRSARP